MTKRIKIGLIIASIILLLCLIIEMAVNWKKTAIEDKPNGTHHSSVSLNNSGPAL